MIFDHNILPKLKSEIDKSSKKIGDLFEEKYVNVVKERKRGRRKDFSGLVS